MVNICGRFALDDKVNALITEFVRAGGRPNDWQPGAEADDPSSWRHAFNRFNVKPTQSVPIIFEGKVGDDEVQRRAELARWSLVPSWSKTLTSKYPTFNARIETAAEKPSFKASVKSKRAIIFSTGWYEWQDQGGPKKVPYFHHAPDYSPLAFSGLYSWWKDPAATGEDDGWVLTATILTTDSIPSLSVHDRAPALLPRSLREHWIDPTVVGDQQLLDEVRDAAAAEAEAIIVDEVAPIPANGDGRELIEPVHAS
ncbi:SOS response-associated peptidase [Gryllotalpicola daejeonensis]|uniref:Abasic site processing protein n=1 Tax=Gryllotalpicola daejeonensis TaxID=993087 RepID=A0ABP7ZCW2_9MICO